MRSGERRASSGERRAASGERRRSGEAAAHLRCTTYPRRFRQPSHPPLATLDAHRSTLRMPPRHLGYTARALALATVLATPAAAQHALAPAPAAAYDPAVPTPRAVLGYEIGERFTPHHLL